MKDMRASFENDDAIQDYTDVSFQFQCPILDQTMGMHFFVYIFRRNKWALYDTHISYMHIAIKTNEYHSIITYVHIYEYLIYIYNILYMYI